jgi:phosphatidylserine/phosphatidylglycerophosphate/cardiolipin synthase-like enzyme
MSSTAANSFPTEAIFTRSKSVADTIEQLIRSTQVSLNAALYRFNSQRLARELGEALKRGVQVRLVIDRNKYEESSATRQLLSNQEIPFRAAYGRDGAGSKMHHKFVVLDDSLVLTGSYNWTFASEEENFENVLILREPHLVAVYRTEFEALWENAKGV